MHEAGEPAVARVAGRLGIPYALSTLGTTSPEDVAAAAPGTDRWFQLYLWNDRDAGVDLVRRARAAGFSALVLTVDTPVAGARLRDVHNGFTIPPTLSRQDASRHRRSIPGWWFDKLTTEPLRFAVFTETQGTVADLINRVFDPTITIADFGWLRDAWDGPLVDQGHPDGRRRARRRRRRCATRSSSRTTGAASSIARRSRSSSCRRSRPRSVIGPRSTSTAGSSTAPTSSPPWRRCPGGAGRAGLPVRADGRRRAGRRAGGRVAPQGARPHDAAARRAPRRRARARPCTGARLMIESNVAPAAVPAGPPLHTAPLEPLYGRPRQELSVGGPRVPRAPDSRLCASGRETGTRLVSENQAPYRLATRQWSARSGGGHSSRRPRAGLPPGSAGFGGNGRRRPPSSRRRPIAIGGQRIRQPIEERPGAKALERLAS